MRSLSLLIDSGDAVVGMLSSAELCDQWFEPSALTEWTNAGLAGHLARSVFNMERAVGATDPQGRVVDDAVAYYTRKDPEPADTEIGRRIRELGDHEAAHGQAALVDRLVATSARLRHLQQDLEPERPVQLFDCVLPAAECAVACLLELVVHAGDLAASLDVETPELPPAATDLVIGTLARIATYRHGSTAMINTLTRPERHPGTISAF